MNKRKPGLNPKTPISQLRNLGPKSALMLAEAGLRTLDELRLLGPVRAYVRVKRQHPRSASLNLLWALAAGLEDRDWRDLTAAEKSALRAEVRGLLR